MSVTVKVKDYSKEAMKGVDESNERGILEMCIKIQAQAKELAPIDTSILKNSISYRTVTGNFGNNLTSAPKPGVGFVGTNIKYAIYQEFGTMRQPAQAFLRPAGLIVKAPNQLHQIIELFDNIMDKHLKKV